MNGSSRARRAADALIQSPPAVAAAVDAAVATARDAGLSYVNDQRPGIHRRPSGKGFRYVNSDGQPVRDKAVIMRIRALAIPPAWTDVWICSFANGHLQATGRDARGRKQYRYHATWRSVRDENKFGRLVDFARALRIIRRKVEADLRLPGLPREKVLAAVVRLLENTFIRIGNERYARENGSFGLTTLRNRHVKVSGERIAFDFRGKSGRQHHVEFDDARLARVIRRCRDLPGYELFQYVDEAGERHSIGSSDVNDYLRDRSGEDYTAKDFRTWAGTVLAVLALKVSEAPRSQAHARKLLNAAIGSVARQLGNTVAVCRACYIHPRVLELFMQGVGQAAPLAFLADDALLVATRRRGVEDAVIRLLTGRVRRPRVRAAGAAPKDPSGLRSRHDARRSNSSGGRDRDARGVEWQGRDQRREGTAA